MVKETISEPIFTVLLSMFKFTIRPRGRFLSLRFVILALVLFALINLRFSLPGMAKPYRSIWSWILDNDRDKNPGLPNDKSFHGNDHFDHVCGTFMGSERVVITVKTGATEASDKIPMQMLTSLLCAPHVFIFSDMEQKIGQLQVFDALDTIPASVKDGNSDFDIYRKQQELQDPVKIASLVRGMKDPQRPEDLAAWTLDKYKNLHIVEKSWALQPDMDWYLHIDADTYVIWSSLIAWLQKLDPSKESFLGSLSYIVGLPFAHGGSGILLSGAAMRNFVITHNGTAARWDYKLHENCCGDWVLAQVLKEYGMDVMNSWPTISGEMPSTIPFASDHWCQPLVTMHHISPDEARHLGNFEQQRHNKREPLTYSELFKGFFSNTLPDHLEDWDNMSGDETVPDIGSAEDCTEACANNANCFQSLYNGVECTLGTKSIIFGVKLDSKDSKKWQSSWNKTRIAEWVSNQPSCDTVTFPFQN